MARQMKDSGIEWIGEIPAHWEMKRLKALFVERKEKNDTVKTDFILSLGAAYGVVPYAEKEGGGNKAKEDLTDYRLAYPNDIVMNSMNIISGSVGISKYFGCVSPVYYMLYPRQDNVDPDFYCYLFQTKAFQRSLLGLGNGILMKESSNGNFNTVRMRIPMEKLGIQLLPMPSYQEQKRIAEFLEQQAVEIDSVIAKTKATIEEYRKLKQSIITDAITKGVRGSRHMKYSGIEWVGDIPADWNVAKIKIGVSKVGSGKTPLGGAESYADEGILFLRSQNVYDTGLLLDAPTYITDAVDEEMKSTRVFPRDVLLNITGGSIGRCCIFPEECVRANVNQHVSIIRVVETVFLPEYMHYYWISSLGHTAINLYQTGGNREGMSADAIKNSPIPVIPIAEQQEIIAYLDEKCVEMDTLIAKKTALLSEMESYKRSVIYEYVTGKKEVK